MQTYFDSVSSPFSWLREHRWSDWHTMSTIANVSALSPATGTASTVDLMKLLSACIDLAQQSGEIIRSISLSGDLKAIDKQSTPSKTKFLEPPNPSVTSASSSPTKSSPSSPTTPPAISSATSISTSTSMTSTPLSPTTPPPLSKAASYAGPGISTTPRRYVHSQLASHEK